MLASKHHFSKIYNKGSNLNQHNKVQVTSLVKDGAHDESKGELKYPLDGVTKMCA